MPTRQLLRLSLVLAALSVLAFPGTALAWGNGASRSGNGFGTHDWILLQASRLAATQGADWVETSVAIPVTDDPDTLLRDQTYHVYDRWGKHSGYADRKVASLYAKAVVQLRAGDRAGASRTVGLLSHYFSDACDPLHTDEVAAEKKVHARYEKAVDGRLKRPDAGAGWVRYDGYQHVRNAGSLTVTSARASHGSYSALVKEFGAHGYDAKVGRISAAAVNRATNGLADIIASISEDAARLSVSPDTASHQGVTTDGTYYYLIHTWWVEKYDMAWNSIDTTFNPTAGIPGLQDETQSHMGAGCVHDGKLYVVAENYPAVTDQHILVFDTETLDLLASVPTSQTHEVAAITAVAGEGDHGVLYVASFYDSSRLFRYDMQTLAYLGELPLAPAPPVGLQALSYHDGRFYLGTGRVGNLGQIYVADTSGSTRLVYTSTLPGTHEGFDFLGDRLIWLVDHGLGDARVWTLKLPIQ